MVRRLAATTCSIAVLLAAVGCGEQRSVADPGPAVRPTSVPPASGVVTTTRSVIVSDDGSGARLCFGDTSFGGRPHCDDADLPGWDWSQHEGGYTESEGVRSGSFVLTGSFDGDAFTATDVQPPVRSEHTFDFKIPCPEPEGGWQVLDPSRTTTDTALEVGDVADRLPGFAMRVVSRTDGSPAPESPEQTVVTVHVTEDPAGAERKLREVWGGMLCVAEVEHSQAELTRIQRQLLDLPGMLSVSAGSLDNQVELTVFHDDGRYQRWADAEYGEGLVEVISVLQPVD